MKTHLVRLACLLSALAVATEARAQDKDLTYQGRLGDATTDASGTYEIRFALFDSSAGGSRQGPILTNSATAVSNGLFTVQLDFGNQFTGAERWLEIAVKTNGAVLFTTLSPRQKITATPYAITAGNLTGPVPASQLTGTLPSALLSGTYANAVTLNNGANSFSGNGANLSALNASQLASGTLADVRLSANVALRGGGNAFTGSQTISGSVVVDQANQNNGNVSSNSLTFGTSSGEGIASRRTSGANQFGLDFYTASQVRMTVLNGGNVGINKTNPATALDVNGGVRARGGPPGGFGANNNGYAFSGNAGDDDSGLFSSANGQVEFYANALERMRITETGNVGIGTIAPVSALQVNGTVTATSFSGNAGATLMLGTTDNQPLEFKVNNQRGLRLEPAGGHPNVIGGYSGNVVNSGFSGATISGGGGSGFENRIGANFATVGGGKGNTAGANFATVGGGERNTTGGPFATVGGGSQNISTGDGATVPGGSLNSAVGHFSFAAGFHAKADHTGAFVWADATELGDFHSTAVSQFLIRATGGVGINHNNPTTALDVNGTVTATSFSGDGAGLTDLNAASLTGTVVDMRLSPNVARRSGGNTFTGDQTIAGNVSVSGDQSFGFQTRQMLNLWGTQYGIGVQSDTVYFRCDTTTHGGFIWYKGGVHDGGYSQPGAGGIELMHLVDDRLYLQGSVVVDQAGLNNGDISSASLTFGPSSGEGVGSTRTFGPPNRFGLDFYTGSQNRMTILNNGDVGIGTLIPTSRLTVIGNVGVGGNIVAISNIMAFGNIQASGSICANNGVNCASDRNVKDGFEPVDTKAILERVAALSLTRWHYTNDPATPHLGAVAQDFHAAFAVGTDDKHIATVDADGVALAAIQGLNQKVDSENAALREDLKRRDAENAQLRQRLEKLEQRIIRLDGGAR